MPKKKTPKEIERTFYAYIQAGLKTPKPKKHGKVSKSKSHTKNM